MTRKTDITPRYSSPSNSNQKLTKVRKTLEWSRFAAFFSIQLVLGTWSTVLLLLAVVNKAERNSLWVQFSILLALGGLVYLVISIYNSFHYGKMAGKFTIPDRVSLTKSTSKKIIRTVILSSLVGMCITSLGSTMIAGVIFSKLFAFQPAIPFYKDAVFVTSKDMFISQACISIIVAHCTGVVNSLWTLNQIEKQSINNRRSIINY